MRARASLETTVLMAWIVLCLLLLLTPWGEAVRKAISRWIA